MQDLLPNFFGGVFCYFILYEEEIMITNKSINEVKEEFGTSLDAGLTKDEAGKRLNEYGENALKEKKAKP